MYIVENMYQFSNHSLGYLPIDFRKHEFINGSDLNAFTCGYLWTQDTPLSIYIKCLVIKTIRLYVIHSKGLSKTYPPSGENWLYLEENQLLEWEVPLT